MKRKAWEMGKMLDKPQAIAHNIGMKKKNPHAVALGRLGGKAGTGKAKARTYGQARRAALIRWGKVKC
jgi:hypothetical protein